MEKKIVFVIQARLGSSRLPGKVLKPLEAWNPIEILVRRLLQEWPLDNIIFAIPDSPSNIPLESTLKNLGVRIQKGSEVDVYQRFTGAVHSLENSFFIRLTADCPLVSIELIKMGIDKFLHGGYDVVHSGNRVAEGLDFEIIDRAAFLAIGKNKMTELQREHPTLYFYHMRDHYRIFDLEPPNEQDDSKFRITLDEVDDLSLISSIVKYFGENIFTCKWSEIRQYLIENKDLMKINSHIERNEGLKNDNKRIKIE